MSTTKIAGTPTADSGPSKVSSSAIILLICMWIANLLNYCDRQAVFAMFTSSRQTWE
ncbi:MAG: hypothetical protein U0930_24900 [Pirellulales bacterium]